MHKSVNRMTHFKRRNRPQKIEDQEKGILTREALDADLAAIKKAYFYADSRKRKRHAQRYAHLMAFLCLTALSVCSADSLQAVPLDSLRAPMTALKTEMWSYMFPVKIAAALVGGVMSLAKQSLTPFGIGAGIAAGIQFFDGVIGDGSAALIGF